MRQRTGPCTVTKCKGKAMKREGSKGWQIAHNKHSLTVFHMILHTSNNCSQVGPHYQSCYGTSRLIFIALDLRL